MDSVHLASAIRGILTAGPAGKGGQGSPMSTVLLMFALIAFSFYFIILRPQKKEQAERKRLLDNLKKGDKVVSIGGIYGTVVEMDKDGDSVVVEVAKNVRLKMLRSAISTIKSRKGDTTLTQKGK